MRKLISVSTQTAETIDKFKATGQSYNGFIEQLLSLWTDIKLNKKAEVKIDR